MKYNDILMIYEISCGVSFYLQYVGWLFNCKENRTFLT